MILLVCMGLLATSCGDNYIFDRNVGYKHEEYYQRKEFVETRHVMLLYSCGFTNISSDLLEDIENLAEGYVPTSGRNDNVLLVYSHSVKKNYNTPNESYLIRFYKNNDEVVRDTLICYDSNVISCSSETLGEVLTDVSQLFPAKSYGLVVSSHGTGWLPAGYYVQRSGYKYVATTGKNETAATSAQGLRDEYFRTAVLPERDPLVKAFGEQVTGVSGNYTIYTMDMKKMAANIPFKLDYLLFDACLMGGIEVAYEFKDKCKVIGISPTEILTNGFNYKTIAERLLEYEPDPVAVCKDYFDFYNAQTGEGKSATICCIDCSKLDALASESKILFEKYRTSISKVNASLVQGYFRSNKHWFYDLRDILRVAGVSSAELDSFDKKLNDCILYKAATEYFLTIEIKHFCGLSSYLPSNGDKTLNNYYLDFKWNKASGLIK